MRLLELFAGSCVVSKAFAARGWTGTCVDLKRDIDPPTGFEVWIWDVMNVTADYARKFDFAWASSPCEEFAVWTMKHFHPNPKYPSIGISLFNHTREILEASGIPYVMENVKGAQLFVGQAAARCGSFYLWGSGIPTILPQGCIKGASQMRRDGSFRRRNGVDELMYQEKGKRARTLATIPAELASCVAEYATRLLEHPAPQPDLSPKERKT